MFLKLDRHDLNSLAVKDCENTLTYGQLIESVCEFAGLIEERCICFNLCTNTVGSLIGYLGCIEGNSVPLMLSRRINDSLLDNLIQTYLPYYFWVPKELAEKWHYQIIFTKYDYCLLKTNNIKYNINDKLQLLMSTSGSTGSPKLVRYKKGNLESNAANVALAFGWTRMERPICDLGMQYTMGLNVINSHLYVGALILLTDYNLVDGKFWDFVKNEKATNFTGVPFSYDILARLGFEKMDLPHLKTLSQGGGKLTEGRFLQFAEYAKKNNKRFIASFGTTETSARIACLPSELALNKICSIGYAIPEGKLFLIDDSGNEVVDCDTEGELCCSGPNVTMGYAYNKEDLLNGDEFNGVYKTGDIAYKDADGCYYITGRKSRFLKLLSYRISLDQSESLISNQFGIECACAGSDTRMDIYITNKQYSDSIVDFISKKIGLFKNLFKVIVVDSIPRNERGKIDYISLSNRKLK